MEPQTETEKRWVHGITAPFDLDKTGSWRDRAAIEYLMQEIGVLAEEIRLCLIKPARERLIAQGTDAILELRIHLENLQAFTGPVGEAPPEVRELNHVKRIRELEEGLKELLEHAEGETCLHEDTRRGGAIWEICSSCGRKWADDEGGKPADAHDYPGPIKRAQELLSPNRVLLCGEEGEN